VWAETGSGTERRARNAVSIAQKLDPESAAAISLHALGLDNRHLSIQAWERALELDPDHTLSYYRYALQMKEDGKLDEAERLIKRAITLSPKSVRFRLGSPRFSICRGVTKRLRPNWKWRPSFTTPPHDDLTYGTIKLGNPKIGNEPGTSTLLKHYFDQVIASKKHLRARFAGGSKVSWLMKCPKPGMHELIIYVVESSL